MRFVVLWRVCLSILHFHDSSEEDWVFKPAQSSFTCQVGPLFINITILWAAHRTLPKCLYKASLPLMAIRKTFISTMQILVCKYQHPEALCCHMADLPYINMDLWSCTSTTSHLASTHKFTEPIHMYTSPILFAQTSDFSSCLFPHVMLFSQIWGSQ